VYTFSVSAGNSAVKTDGVVLATGREEQTNILDAPKKEEEEEAMVSFLFQFVCHITLRGIIYL